MKVSIIIPVLHESQIIQSLIKHLQSVGKGIEHEIIVVDGSPTRDTISLLKDNGIIKIAAERSRARQMNRGAQTASGEVLLFLHADTLLPEKALEKILKALKNNIYVGGSFSLAIGSEWKSLKFISWMANMRTRLTNVPFGDQAIFIIREYFSEIGGYKDVPLMEDMEIMERIKKAGGRICILKDKVITSPRKWEKNGVFRTSLKNVIIRMLYLLGVSPYKLHKLYYGYYP